MKKLTKYKNSKPYKLTNCLSSSLNFFIHTTNKVDTKKLDTFSVVSKAKTASNDRAKTSSDLTNNKFHHFVFIAQFDGHHLLLMSF